MTDSPLSSTAPIRSGKTLRLRGGWLLLGIAFMVAVGAAVTIERLTERADECRRSQTDLAQLRADAQEINALEWRTIFQQESTGEASEHLEILQAKMHQDFSRLGRLATSLPQLAEAAKCFRAYDPLTDQEFKLVADGKIKEAKEFDEAEVDPAAEMVQSALQGWQPARSPRSESAFFWCSSAASD
jgi:hypothetical protein